MKIIELPKPKVIGEREWTAKIMLEEVILARPIWRQRDFSDTALIIYEKLESDESSLALQDAEHERLERACSGSGVLGMDGVSVAPPELNRYLLLLLRAIQRADSAKK
jgi:hypothetical protein